MKEENTITGLYFGVLPDFNELMGCLIENEDEGHNIIQPLGCRELLFTDPRLLLSPCLECGHQAFILFKKPVLKCSKFQTLMKKLNFKIVKEVHITKELFQFCLGFTLTQKLAPLWNKVGEYFIQGRDFLENGKKMNAVTMDVSIQEDKLCIGLKAFNVKLRQAQPDHFCSSSNVLQHFFTQNEATIEEYSIQDSLCFVLPSLKKARVIGICHRIPSECPFASYEDLRKHWKLMYGYRLPASEQVFYNVKFLHPKSKVFTYPSGCIRSAFPQVLPRCDQQAIFHAFLQDIQARSPVICESPLKLTSTPLYCSNSLYSAANGNQSSLTRAAPDAKHCTPFLSTFKKQNQLTAVTNYTDAVKDDNSDATSTIGDKPTHDLTHDSNISSISALVTFNKPDGSRFVPSFTKSQPTKYSSQIRSVTKPNLSRRTPIRPVFKSKVIPKVHPKDSPSCVKVQNNAQRTSTLPSTLPTKLPPGATHTGSFLPKVQSNHDTPCAKKLPEVRPGLVLMRGDQTGSLANSPYIGSVRNSTSAEVNFGCQSTNIVGNIPRTQSVTSSNTKHGIAVAPPGSVKKDLNSKECVLGLPSKRQNKSLESNAAQIIKKPRMKPKVQENVDVKQLALTNQLNKVNSSTLIDWLKKRNVPVKQKDKKTELMEKVMNFIRSNNAPLKDTCTLSMDS